MLNKIFLLLLAISIIAITALTFYSYTWLQSVDKPATVAANYELYSGFAMSFLWISSLILLIFANVLLWTNKSIWSLWTTFLYFAVFTLLNFFWLSESFFTYKKANGLWEGGFSVAGIFGAVIVVAAGVGVFFDQFIVTRLRDKMLNKPTEIAVEEPQLIESESDKVS